MKWHPKKSVNTFYSPNFPCFVRGQVQQYPSDSQPLPGCLLVGAMFLTGQFTGQKIMYTGHVIRIEVYNH